MADFDPALWEEVEPPPEGWEYADEQRQPNAIERATRGLLTVFPGPSGRGSLADVIPEEQSGVVGRGVEEGLSQILDPVVRGPAAVANIAEGALARAGNREPRPYTEPTGRGAAAALLSPAAARLGLETAGSLAATAATGGAAAPATIGRLAARLGASALGGAAGSIAAEAVDPSGRPIARAAETALFSLGGEAVGSSLNRVIRGGTRMVKGGAADLDTMEKLGGTLSPGQISRNPVITTVESWAEQGLTGGGTLAAARGRSAALATAAANDFVDASLQGASREDVGRLALDALTDAKQAFSATASSLYDQVDQLAGVARVDLSDALTLAQTIVKDNPRSPGATKLVQWIADEQKRAGGGPVPFAAAQKLRSDLLGLTDLGESGFLIRGQAEAAAKRVSGAVDSAMETAASGVGANAQTAWRAANQFYKNGAQTFNAQMVRALARAEPEEVFRVGIRNASPEAVTRLRGIINDAPTWERLKGVAGRNLLDGVTNAEGVISGSKLLTQITAANGPFGPAKLRVLFGDAGAQQLTKIASALRATQATSGQHVPGGVRMRFFQGGAGVGLGGLGLSLAGPAGGAAGAASVFLLPAAAMKFMTNPQVAHWLTVGIQAKPGSQAARRAFVQLAAHAADLHTEEFGPETPLPTVTRMGAR